MPDELGSVRIGKTQLVNLGDRILIRNTETNEELTVFKYEVPELAQRLKEAGRDA